MVTEKMEAEQLAISEGTPVAAESQPTNALIRCGGLVSSAADTPGKTRLVGVEARGLCEVVEWCVWRRGDCVRWWSGVCGLPGLWSHAAHQ